MIEGTGWKIGPLPPDTWHWGAVVLVGMKDGFLFADFCGDHVKLVPGGETVRPDEIVFYNNCIELPDHNCLCRVDSRR